MDEEIIFQGILIADDETTSVDEDSPQYRKINSLEADKHRLQNEKNVLSSRVEQLEAQIRILEDENKNVKAENDRLEKQYDDLDLRYDFKEFLFCELKKESNRIYEESKERFKKMIYLAMCGVYGTPLEYKMNLIAGDPRRYEYAWDLIKNTAESPPLKYFKKGDNGDGFTHKFGFGDTVDYDFPDDDTNNSESESESQLLVIREFKKQIEVINLYRQYTRIIRKRKLFRSRSQTDT